MIATRFSTNLTDIRPRPRLKLGRPRFGATIAVLTIFACLIAAEAAVDREGEAKSKEQRTILTEADAGKTVTLPVGQSLEVVLKANSTTGYSWKLKQFFKKGKATQLTGEKYESDPNPRGAVGAGGRTRFTFKAVSEGKTKISLVYSQGPNGETAERFSVTVHSITAESQ